MDVVREAGRVVVRRRDVHERIRIARLHLVAVGDRAARADRERVAGRRHRDAARLRVAERVEDEVGRVARGRVLDRHAVVGRVADLRVRRPGLRHRDRRLEQVRRPLTLIRRDDCR